MFLQVISGRVIISSRSKVISIILCSISMVLYSSFTSHSSAIYFKVTRNEFSLTAKDNEISEYKTSMADPSEKTCTSKALEVIHHFKRLVRQNDSFLFDDSDSACFKFLVEKVS